MSGKGGGNDPVESGRERVRIQRHGDIPRRASRHIGNPTPGSTERVGDEDGISPLGSGPEAQFQTASGRRAHPNLETAGRVPGIRPGAVFIAVLTSNNAFSASSVYITIFISLILNIGLLLLLLRLVPQ